MLKYKYPLMGGLHGYREVDHEDGQID